jgi:hypothetical protein
MKALTVAQLLEQGNRVFVSHKRNFIPTSRLRAEEPLTVGAAKKCGLYQKYGTATNILPRGGETVVEIITPEGEVFAAAALCSEADNYNKALGRAIAIGRALSKPPVRIEQPEEMTV